MMAMSAAAIVSVFEATMMSNGDFNGYGSDVGNAGDDADDWVDGDHGEGDDAIGHGNGTYFFAPYTGRYHVILWVEPTAGDLAKEKT